MLKGKGKVWSGAGNARCHVVYIPADIVKDSQYPFKQKESVNVELDPVTQKLIITKLNKD